MHKAWIFYSLLTIFTWGFYGIFVKLAVRQLNSWSAYILSFLPTLIIVLLSFALPRLRPQFEFSGIFFAILAGLAGTIGTVLFFKAMTIGPAAIIIPFTALYPIVTVILAVMFLGEKLTVSQGLGVALALIAAFLLAR